MLQRIKDLYLLVSMAIVAVVTLLVFLSGWLFLLNLFVLATLLFAVFYIYSSSKDIRHSKFFTITTYILTIAVTLTMLLLVFTSTNGNGTSECGELPDQAGCPKNTELFLSVTALSPLAFLIYGVLSMIAIVSQVRLWNKLKDKHQKTR
jgi:hypothetical protein